MKLTANGNGAEELSDNGKLELVGDAPSGKEDSSGTIRDLTRRPSSGGSSRGECRLQFAKHLCRDTIANSIILVNNDFLGLLGLGVGPLDLDW